MDTPVIVTENDVKDPQLLLRQLRNSSDRLLSLAKRVDKIEHTPTTPDFGEIRRQMQASGNSPINVNGLLGVLAQPQPASVTLYNTAPTGPVLQQLRDQQLVLIGTTATGFALNFVQGGNPGKLFQLTGGLTTGSVGSSSTGQLPIVVASSVINAQSSNVAATTIYTPAATGQYRINYVMQTTATGTSSVTFNLTFTDDVGGITQGQSPMFFNAASRQNGVITFRSCSAAAIQYSMLIATSTVAPIGAYSVYTQLERLS